MAAEELRLRIEREVVIVGGRRRYSPELKQAILEHVEPRIGAGEALEDLERVLGVNAWTMQRWRQRARESARILAPNSLGQAPMPFVRLEAATLGAPLLEVAVRPGAVVRVPVGFDSGTLSRLLALLEGGAR